MDNSAQVKRISYFDVAKFLAIFLVVWGHVVQQSCMLKNPFNDYVYQTIYTFHMPLFMGLCGFFFHKSVAKFYNIDNYIFCKLKSRLVSLVVPMMAFGFIKMVLLGNYGIMNYLLQVKGIWFLGALALNTIAVLCALKYKSSKRTKCYPLALLAITIASLAVLYKGMGVFMLIFFFAGFLASKYGFNVASNNKHLIISCIAFVVFDVAYNMLPGGVGSFSLNFIKYSLRDLVLLDCVKTILGFLGSYIFLTILSKIKWADSIYQYMLLRGRYTLDIYLLNIVILEIILGTAYRKLVSMYHVNAFYEYGLLWEVFSTFIVAVLITEMLFQIGQAMRKSAYIRAIFFAAK